MGQSNWMKDKSIITSLEYHLYKIEKQKSYLEQTLNPKPSSTLPSIAIGYLYNKPDEPWEKIPLHWDKCSDPLPGPPINDQKLP